MGSKIKHSGNARSSLFIDVPRVPTKHDGETHGLCTFDQQRCNTKQTKNEYSEPNTLLCVLHALLHPGCTNVVKQGGGGGGVFHGPPPFGCLTKSQKLAFLLLFSCLPFTFS
jgi:hypothetical protein